MGRNLGPLNIKDSYEGLVQISGSNRDTLTDGSGSVITNLDVTSSFALTASFAENVVPTPTGSFMVTGSVVDATLAFLKGDGTTFPLTVNNVENAVSASYALTASYAENASVGTLQEVTDAGNTTTNSISVSALEVDAGSPTDKKLEIYRTGNGIHYDFSGSGADDHMFEINQDDILRLQPTVITAYKDIDATGLTITANQVDATTFNGNLNGTASVSTAATIFGDNTNAERPLVFVDDNPATGVGQVEQLRGDTTKSITYNPVTNRLTVPSANISTALTASGLIYPTADGTVGQVVTTDGAGNLTLEDAAGGDAFPYTGSAEITGSLGVTGSLEVIGNITTGNSTNNNTGTNNAIIGGTNSSTGFRNSVVLGGDNNVASSYESATIGGINNNNPAGRSVIVGCNNNSITANNTEAVAILGANNATISGNHQTANVIVGGSSLTIDGDDFNNKTRYNILLGGQSNKIRTIGSLSGSEKSFILGGEGNEMVADLGDGTHLQGSGIIGGLNHQMINNRSVIIGGTNITSSADNTVYVPNLDISGSLTDSDGNIGTVGQVLTSNGTDKVQWDTVGGGGAAEWQAATAASSSVSALNNIPGDIAASSPYSLLYSSGSAITSGDGWSVVLGGFNHQMGGSGRNTLIGGDNNTITNNYRSGILGGSGNTLSSGAGNAFIIGGDGNSCAQGNGGIFGGRLNTITSTGFGRNVILGGESNTINGQAPGRQSILGGEGNTNSHSYSVVIGGQSLSTTKNDEVVVPSLDINGTVVQSVQALTITSNTASLDASTGQMFTLGLQNGVDTLLELSNQVAGQTFSLKITNNATSAGTITFDNQFDFEGGTAFTATAATNAVDILTFTTFDGSNVQCVGSKNFS